MTATTPIYKIAKDLGIDSNRIILACKKLGIYAKGSTKRLSKVELNKILKYFDSGKNVSEEIIEISNQEHKREEKPKINKPKKPKNFVETKFFPNRLIR